MIMRKGLLGTVRHFATLTSKLYSFDPPNNENGSNTYECMPTGHFLQHTIFIRVIWACGRVAPIISPKESNMMLVSYLIPTQRSVRK
jgi:hypothetical protein